MGTSSTREVSRQPPTGLMQSSGSVRKCCLLLPLFAGCQRLFCRDYYDSKQADQGFITFDLQADLAPLFNWNVKVLFLYLSAEYSTPTTSHNTAVLWDKIIMRGEKTKLDLKSIKTKYYFRDESEALSGETVNLTLSWNVMPNMGHLTWVKAEERHTFTFPTEYYSV